MVAFAITTVAAFACGIAVGWAVREDQRPKAKLDVTEYRLAPSGEGEKAYEWADKPHRLVYDLCREVERLSRG